MSRIAREPALLWMGLVAPIVQAVTAFLLDANPALQGAVNALAAALAGAIVAAVVRSDGQVAAITGVVQAIFALILAFGVPITSEQQSLVMTAVGLIAAVLVRDRVVAPVPATAAA